MAVCCVGATWHVCPLMVCAGRRRTSGAWGAWSWRWCTPAAPGPATRSRSQVLPGLAPRLPGAGRCIFLLNVRLGCGANPVAKLSRASCACKKCEQIVAHIHTCKWPDPYTGHTIFRLSFALTHSWHSVCPSPFCQDSAQCTTSEPSLFIHLSLNYGDLLPGNLHSFHHESFLIFFAASTIHLKSVNLILHSNTRFCFARCAEQERAERLLFVIGTIRIRTSIRILHEDSIRILILNQNRWWVSRAVRGVRASDAGAVPHVPADLLSPEACGFLHRCLQRDPTARAEAPALLQHPWIRTGAAGPSAVVVAPAFPTPALPVEHWAHYQAAVIRQHSPAQGCSKTPPKRTVAMMVQVVLFVRANFVHTPCRKTGDGGGGWWGRGLYQPLCTTLQRTPVSKALCRHPLAQARSARTRHLKVLGF